MTRTAFFLALVLTALAGMPAHAQVVRAFVSGHGLDTNPCTESQPCRTFQQAFNTVPANSVIWVLDPAGYGPLSITHGISIQAGGMGEITQTGTCSTCAAITVSVTTSDPVTLNGLVLEGDGTGGNGIYITSGPSVQILNSVIRHFQRGISNSTSTNGSNLLVEDTIASDNQPTGISIGPSGSSGQVTLSRITANNNQYGVDTADVNMTIANSVMSNNALSGLQNASGVTWLAKSVISGNTTGVTVTAGTVKSYGDNYINNNGTPVTGSLSPVAMQ